MNDPTGRVLQLLLAASPPTRRCLGDITCIRRWRQAALGLDHP